MEHLLNIATIPIVESQLFKLSSQVFLHMEIINLKLQKSLVFSLNLNEQLLTFRPIPHIVKQTMRHIEEVFNVLWGLVIAR